MRYSLLVAALLMSLSAIGQPGYKIDFTIKGWKDTTAYLGYFQGDQTYVRDTARVNAKGEFTFEGSKPLLQGIYILVVEKSRLLDFVVGADQRFSVETEKENMIKAMKVTGDDDNKVFFDYARFDLDQRIKAEPLVKVLRDSSLREDAKKDARESFRKVSEDVITYQSELIKNHSTTMTARYLKAQREVEVPPTP